MRTMITKLRKHTRYYLIDLRKSIQFAFSTRKSQLAILVMSAITFLFFIMLTFPRYAIQMVTAGPEYWNNMIISLIWLITESSGFIGISLIAIYALVTGILITVVLRSIKYQSHEKSGLLSILPAIVFSGCASCGAGLLGVLGAFGYASIFPFGGNLVRFLGILLVLGVLMWTGDPRECAV